MGEFQSGLTEGLRMDCRSVGRDTAARLDDALSAAPYGTRALQEIVKQCARNARCEIAAQDALRDVVNAKGGAGGLSTALEQLNAAISAAAFFPSLQVPPPSLQHIATSDIARPRLETDGGPPVWRLRSALFEVVGRFLYDVGLKNDVVCTELAGTSNWEFTVKPALLVQTEVEEARALKARWERRAEAVARLDGIMEAVRQNPDNLSPSSNLSSSITAHIVV